MQWVDVIRLGLRRGGVVAFAEGRDTDIVYRDGMRGIGHGSRDGRNVGSNARRTPNEGINGNLLRSSTND